MQADRSRDVIKFFATDFFQRFSPGLELFIDLDRFLGHLLVCFLAPTHQGNIRTRCNAFMAVRIEADAEHECLTLLFLGNLRHAERLATTAWNSRSKQDN